MQATRLRGRAFVVLLGLAASGCGGSDEVKLADDVPATQPAPEVKVGPPKPGEDSKAPPRSSLGENPLRP